MSALLFPFLEAQSVRREDGTVGVVQRYDPDAIVDGVVRWAFVLWEGEKVFRSHTPIEACAWVLLSDAPLFCVVCGAPATLVCQCAVCRAHKRKGSCVAHVAKVRETHSSALLVLVERPLKEESEWKVGDPVLFQSEDLTRDPDEWHRGAVVSLEGEGLMLVQHPMGKIRRRFSEVKRPQSADEKKAAFFALAERAGDPGGGLLAVPGLVPAEKVDHPAHYGGKDNPYEAIKVIEAWELGFCLGNTVKYIARAERKGASLEDLQKARWYLDREITRREGRS